MKSSTWRGAFIVGLGGAVLAGCPAGSNEIDQGGDGGAGAGFSTGQTGASTTGTANQTSGPSTAPATSGPSTAPSTTATTGSGTPLCTGGDPLETLPIDPTGWIPTECTVFAIQGAWYCFDDAITSTSCIMGAAPYENGGMCLDGTALGPQPGTWGGGMGLSLQDTGGMNPMKLPYDAAAHGINGFHIVVTGSTGGNPLRIGFTTSAAPSGPSPFVTINGPGAYDIAIADAIVPISWNVPNAGETANASAIYDVQVQLAGDTVAAAFDFCITELTPIGGA